MTAARKTVPAVYVCGPVLKMWTEPFIVEPHEGNSCEMEAHGGRSVPARWTVEVVGYKGHDEAPYIHPLVFSCDKHLAATMEQFL